MNDLKFALRQLLKNPGFTAVAVLTLALGIGANTAIFSAVNAVLLKALPYHDPDRIVMIWTDNPKLHIGFHELPPTPMDLPEWRRQAQSFEEIAAFRSRPADFSESGNPERVGGVQVTANFFALLGVKPLIGRTFSAEEEFPGQDKVAIISHGLWRRRFGGDTNVIGQIVTINQQRRQLVGVMPPGFSFPRGSEMPPAYGLMTQSILLSVIGGVAGLGLGVAGIRVMLALAPGNISRLHDATLDWQVLLFTLSASLLTGFLFGVAPAWHASKINLIEALNTGGRAGSAGRQHRTRGILVAAEVALAVILLTGAGLMVQSFARLQAVDLGFKPQQIAAFDVTLYGGKYTDFARMRQFYREARERLRAIPGVRAAAAISSLPMGGDESYTMLIVEGQPLPKTGGAPNAANRKVTPGYFETMGIALVRGRDFNDQDTAEQLQVCVINETTARNYFSDTDPIGKRLKLGSIKNAWLKIVGVVGDVRGHSLEKKPGPQVYRPVEQDIHNPMTFAVRAESLTTIERALRIEMKSLDDSLPLANFRTTQSLVSNAVAGPRFSTILIGLFALTALLLTIVGLYGVVAYSVGQRTREIGIRMALGARRSNVLALVIRQGMRPALIGLSIGLAGALALTRLLTTQLYEVKPTDPATFMCVSVILVLMTIAACWLPARRATNVHPMEALRYE